MRPRTLPAVVSTSLNDAIPDCANVCWTLDSSDAETKAPLPPRNARRFMFDVLSEPLDAGGLVRMPIIDNIVNNLYIHTDA
jgi:hypothetical protein